MDSRLSHKLLLLLYIYIYIYIRKLHTQSKEYEETLDDRNRNMGISKEIIIIIFFIISSSRTSPLSW
ncbi:hypothetical protein Pint_32499 [Pistacia integerrima]|uniref:Uncharacterized protein n=1 Tax=Pistacia integerrima TaxID=434235 RepID=A0ACC0XSA7_9ROSI|nr:hypothetical protein Pint_32499 [Pistacia integerrima]